MAIGVEPHLVLLPGLDGTGKLFEPFIQQFADMARITVIPYPLDRHIPFEQMTDYLLPLLPKETPLVILGESYSGPVALSLAARGVENIKAIVLVATFAKYPGTYLKTLSKYLPLALLLRLPVPNCILRHYCFGRDSNAELRNSLRDSVKANKPHVLADRMREGAQADVTAVLPAIKIPCLYVAASNDKLVPASAIMHLTKNLSNLDVAVVPGSHFILQVQPRACYQVVMEFIKNRVITG